MVEEHIANELAKNHRSISVAEFFERNKHLLGFSNNTKSLITCVREAVDNALDACEESRILPSIYIELNEISEETFKLVIEDNGPGIKKSNIPNIFAKLLYGSNFNLKQSRGQQGIGISASVLYSQLSTGRSTKIYSRIGDGKTHIFKLRINVDKNEPEIISDETIKAEGRGTRIELIVRGRYVKGKQSIEEYLIETAIMNPYAQIVFVDPEGKSTEFTRVVNELPVAAKSIKPHPYGLELGILMRLLKNTKASTIPNFFSTEFSRIGRDTSTQICKKAKLETKLKPSHLSRDDAENLLKAIKSTKIQAPPTDCLSPVGEESIKKGLKKEMNPEFVSVVSRPPSVYSGYPFQIEVGIGYGGDLNRDGPIQLMRFANKVPLIYEQSGCAITKSVLKSNWKRYGVQQSKNTFPTGPIAIVIHIASVWVPYTSEGKEAIANYSEIIKEVQKGIQEAARKLKSYLAKKQKIKDAQSRKNTFQKYSLEIIEALHSLTNIKKEQIEQSFNNLLEKKMEAFEVDLTKVSKGVTIDEDYINAKPQKSIKNNDSSDDDSDNVSDDDLE
jgi:DNA topoisomerase VI subunit B